MSNIKTTLHTYHFDVSRPEESVAYSKLKARLEEMGLECFETWGGRSHYLGSGFDGAMVELETTHLFSDQWNSAPIEGLSDKGYRLFDWAQDYPAGLPRGIKRGHWLEQTPEMREIRRNTHKCGYCGNQEPAAKGNVFCPHCLDSEYLKESELKLLRMRAIDEDRADRPELTEAEKAHLLPLYRAAQLHGTTERGKARIAKQRKDIATELARDTYTAKTKHDGLLWLMDHGINIGNVIYYSHTDKFSFGWRQPCDAAFVSGLLEIISEFPFAYEIKCTDGRTLSGN